LNYLLRTLAGIKDIF